MNMWAVSNMPVYPVERGTRPKGSKAASKGPFKKSRILGLEIPTRETTFPALRPATSADTVHHDTHSVDRLLDPAVDGPPSPESIRELSDRMKRASVRDKHHSHQTSSSGSSSLRSLTSTDRPSWENASEGKSLSRKSSGRSTSSSMPSKDRPESVQIFGKTIFNRRAKLRRDSSAQSSSASSMYSSDAVPSADAALPPAPTSAPSRDSTIPALFGLRRGSKQDQTKLSISGPYNFQHVAHTQKDHVADAQRSNRVPHPPRGSTTDLADGTRDDMYFAGFSTDSLPLTEENRPAVPEPQPTTTLTRTPSILRKHPSRRLTRAMSQEHLNRSIPPPRPLRSPIEQSFPSVGPVPPPRGSSARHERFDSVDRPPTSTSFRSHAFSLASDAGSPPPSSHGYVPGLEMDIIPEHAYSNVTSPPDDANWPLPCPSSTASEYTLPNVPEEDETIFLSKKSRASVASNSSLRGSQSVPMLRAFSAHQSEDSDRRSSQTSDTLGRFDLFAAERALKASLMESNRGEGLRRESWEDDVDYCYEHAAEADCDYEWDRPSFETSRDGDSATPVDDQFRNLRSCEVSPAMLTPGQFDVPALSPVSQLSATTAQEAITPTAVNNPKASNFSLPRVESKNLLHVRKPSDASSFKESHGFTLSPSLLIPMDYQQQMMACEAEKRDTSDFAFNMDPSALLLQYRTSSSTTGTADSSNSSSEKHISTASTSTDFTRLTQSTGSLDMENHCPRPDTLQRFPSFESQSRTEAKSAMPTLPESEEAAIQRPTRRPEFKSRGSESNLGRLAMDEPWPGKAKMPIQARRGRARTASLSTPPPPNQYVLFPSVQLTGNRI
ncbi:hypothetical protein VTK26DRAFT_962 [Humicola hyalothermophila]